MTTARAASALVSLAVVVDEPAPVTSHAIVRHHDSAREASAHERERKFKRLGKIRHRQQLPCRSWRQRHKNLFIAMAHVRPRRLRKVHDGVGPFLPEPVRELGLNDGPELVADRVHIGSEGVNVRGRQLRRA